MISLVNWAWLRKNYSELEDMTIETQKLKKRLKKEPKTEYPCRKKTGEKKKTGPDWPRTVEQLQKM